MNTTEDVSIIPYNPVYKTYFEKLNLEWIEKYFKVEEPDRKALQQPEEYVLHQGGQIFFAQYQGEIVGTCALLKESDSVYELAKMAVSPLARGKQIGKKLGLHAIEAARQLGAKQLYLESNTKLVPAIELYKKLGFREVEKAPSPYQRANIRMQIDF